MPLYKCNVCQFNSQLKTNYERHLKTKKHLRHTDQLPPKVEEKNDVLTQAGGWLPIAPKLKNQDHGKKGGLPIAPKSLNLSKINTSSFWLCYNIW